MRSVLLAALAAFVLPMLTAAAQDLPDTDQYRQLTAQDPAAARDLQDQRIHECLRGQISSERAVSVCTWVIDVARVAGSLAGEAYARRARAYVALGDVQAADSDFSDGIGYWDQIQPNEPANIPTDGPNISAAPLVSLTSLDHADAHCDRGDFYWRQSNTARATQSYRRALEYHNECAERPLADIAAGLASPNGVLRHIGTYVPGAHALDLDALNAACSAQRAAAILEALGPNPTPEQIAALDSRMRSSALASRDINVLRTNLEAFRAGNSAIDRYGACLFQSRLVQLDPQNQLTAAAADPFAGLPRRSAGAGTQALADSVDPVRRAQRQREEQQRVAEVERRQQEARASARAFWGEVFEVVAVVAVTVAEVELQRMQIEAAHEAQRQAASPPPVNSSGGYVGREVLTNNTGHASVEGQYQDSEPPGQRIYDTAEQYQGTNGGASGRRQTLNPQTGQPCVTQTSTTRSNHSNGDIAHRIHFANSCGQVFNVYARQVPGPHGVIDDGISGSGILAHDQMYLTCMEHVRAVRGCRGFAEWWVR